MSAIGSTRDLVQLRIDFARANHFSFAAARSVHHQIWLSDGPSVSFHYSPRYTALESPKYIAAVESKGVCAKLPLFIQQDDLFIRV